MNRYRGVEITNTYFTGHKNEILPVLIRSVGQIIRSDRGALGAYVGVASGPDYWEALKRRIDAKKLAHGVSTMHLLYMSLSENYTRSLEESIRAHFQDLRADARFWNATGGGGGRRGSGPMFCLYLAVST